MRRSSVAWLGFVMFLNCAAVSSEATPWWDIHVYLINFSSPDYIISKVKLALE